MILKLGRGSAEGGVSFRSTVVLVDKDSGEGVCSVEGTSSTALRAEIEVGASH